MSNEFSKYVPHMRVEKTHTVRDDFRVVMAGIMFFIFMALMQPWVLRIYDTWFAERPFVAATVEIYQITGRDLPMIMYDADATQYVDGQWIASLYSAIDNSRIQSRRGNGSYNTQEDEPRLWTWQGFFDNEISDTPPVPTEPFYICVRYIVSARDSGAMDESIEPFCSSVFDPHNPTPLPSQGGFDDVDS